MNGKWPGRWKCIPDDDDSGTSFAPFDCRRTLYIAPLYFSHSWCSLGPALRMRIIVYKDTAQKEVDFQFTVDGIGSWDDASYNAISHLLSQK